MCGIFGSFHRNPSPRLEEQLQAAQRLLQNRGPDDRGLQRIAVAGGQIALGQTRLSIIDLTPGGHQPMSSLDGRYTIVFNGEIYNYKELREELKLLGCRFQSDSDTEVLLAAWAAWGVRCLPRLVGMFAFAMLDRQDVTLTCVRDAFGIKPFFYAPEEGDFLFASEAPALLALKSAKTRPNWQRAYDYLVHGTYDSSPETFFDGVLQLSAGYFLVVDLGARKVGAPERWWTPRITERHDLSFEDAAELVRENFLQSIRLHLRSDVPLGAALSGGVDSSAVVCAMRHVAPDHPIHTFSYIAAGSAVNEEKWVDLVNQRVGAHAHKVMVTPQELTRDLDDMIRAQGEPFGSMSIYAQYRVYQLAKENGITVTLDGQGADEMLGGYVGFPGERVRSLLDAGRPGEALAFLRQWSQWPGRSMAMGVKAVLAEWSTGALHELMRMATGMNKTPDWIDGQVAGEMALHGRVKRFRSGAEASGRRMSAQMTNMLMRHGLPGLLRHGDRNSMRFSIESRVPFLTLEQVELTLSLPERYLVSDAGETKHVFRRAMQGIVPDEILSRKDKIGFEPPEKEWLVSIAAQAREWLSEDLQIPFVRRDALLAQFEDVIAGRRAFSWQVWRWINFYRWKACVAD
ncbi:MAG: asparagine synthase (glutamine-hydrolyzing) [Burkholderiales bacterium]|nr:asparagine synthase (glutamine-hydrolyzing) [Burkholderiales bacterium]